MSIAVVNEKCSECFRKVYRYCEFVFYKNMYFRRDIGKQYILADKSVREASRFKYGLLNANIPKIAIIEGNNNSDMFCLMDTINFVQHKNIMNLPSKQRIHAEIGVVICHTYASPLFKNALEFKLPLFVCQKEATNYNIIDILRSFNIDMVLYSDLSIYKSIPEIDLVREYDKNCIQVYSYDKVCDNSLSHTINQLNILVSYTTKIGDAFIKIPLYQNQHIFSEEHLEHNISNSKNKLYDLDNRYKLTKSNLEQNAFIQYLLLYNQQPLKYSVDIETGNKFVEYLKKDNSSIGNFCSFFNPNKALTKGIDNQTYLMATSTDGVGTKLDLALQYNTLDTIGIDLVAMCVNDLYVHGVKPTNFLDYIAIDQMDITICKQLIDGIKKGCTIARCSLDGGETAEMKGIYRSRKCDIAGFSVGIQQYKLPKKDSMEPGCKIYGLLSSGIHSNGFTLIRLILDQIKRYHKIYEYNTPVTEEYVKQLLAPTKIYNEIPKMLEYYFEIILGFSHITGGGFSDNICRVLPNNLSYKFAFDKKDIFNYLEYMTTANKDFYAILELYRWVQYCGKLTIDQMMNTFNCGIGMIVIMKQYEINSEEYKRHQACINKYNLVYLGELCEKSE
jgi:phosphoribosylformylglycinamidine cyclo-ligase